MGSDGCFEDEIPADPGAACPGPGAHHRLPCRPGSWNQTAWVVHHSRTRSGAARPAPSTWL
jgi:hypothetical protein